MKVVLLIAVLIASTLAYGIAEKDGFLQFQADSNEDSFFGFVMEGIMDLHNPESSEAKTFLRLAETLIPIAESKVKDMGDTKLQWARQWCYGNLGDAVRVCVNATAEWWIGWRVSQLGKTGYYNVTYTPFTYIRAGSVGSASSYPAEVAVGGYISVVDITVPVNLLLAQSQICYSAVFNMEPVQAYTSLSTALLGCYRSIPDRTDWSCNRTSGPEFKLNEYDFAAGNYFQILPYTCINF